MKKTQLIMLCVWFWTLVINQVIVTGSSIHLHLEKQPRLPYSYTKLSSYGYEVGTSTCIVFEYKGCNDAFVALMQEDDDTDSKSMYEVLIGGWKNTRSVIRLIKHSMNFKARKVLRGVVDCNESRKFKVGWKDGNITAYRWVKPCQWEVIMSWHNTWYAVNYIGVTTGIWAIGDWIIYNEECHEPINKKSLWINDIKRKDTMLSAPMFIKPDIDSSLLCAVQCHLYSECCFYTYNGKHRDCRGYSSSIHLHLEKQPRLPYSYTKLSSYGYEVGTSTCIVFEYKGCNDAFVALMQEDDDTDSKSMYEVLIGGWKNTRSVIRLIKHSMNFKARKVLRGVVDCNESRKFKVGWKDGNITAYRWVKPCQWEVIMSWHNTWYAVNYIGVTTGIWAIGDWIIYNEECHEPINKKSLWINDIKRKDTMLSAPMFIKPDIDSSLLCAVQCHLYSECCFYTYNGKHRDCRGYSKTSSSTTSKGTQLWIRS